MTDEDLSARLRAVERALTDGEAVPDLSAAADAERRLDALEAEVEGLTERVDALDATVQSLHGYVGELEHVNDRVERRADAARAAVERLEGRRTPPGGDDGDAVDGVDERGVDDQRAEDVSAEIRHEPGDEPAHGSCGADGASAHGHGAGNDQRRPDDESLLGRVRDAL